VNSNACSNHAELGVHEQRHQVMQAKPGLDGKDRVLAKHTRSIVAATAAATIVPVSTISSISSTPSRSKD
jgi:hypothetical protein